MRVIAGTFRSRLLVSPRGLETRPTSDRLRERLFDILATRLPGSRFVDLYAGTGAVGIEAISRGAEHVWFAENAKPAIGAIRTNLEALKITHGYTLEERGVGAVLQQLAKLNRGVDMVFLDPPYEAEAEYANTLGFLGSERGRSLLQPGAVVVVEHRSKTGMAQRYGGLERTRVVKQGDAALSFFSAMPDDEKEPSSGETRRPDAGRSADPR